MLALHFWLRVLGQGTRLLFHLSWPSVPLQPPFTQGKLSHEQKTIMEQLSGHLSQYIVPVNNKMAIYGGFGTICAKQLVFQNGYKTERRPFVMLIQFLLCKGRCVTNP